MHLHNTRQDRVILTIKAVKSCRIAIWKERNTNQQRTLLRHKLRHSLQNDLIMLLDENCVSEGNVRSGETKRMLSLVSIVIYGLYGYQNGQKSELGKQFVKYIGEERNNYCSVIRVILTCQMCG